MNDSSRFSQPGSDPRDPNRRTQFDPQNNAVQGQQNASEAHGSLEPDDSRNVTGASGSMGVGSPGGSDQQTGGERWGGGQQGQAETPDAAGQLGESYGENTAADQMTQFETGSSGRAGEIREHMEVIGADGVHLGTVDKVEGDRIKLTKADSGMGGHEGHHHFISCGLVAGVEGDKVRLSATAANAYGMEEEE